MKMPILAAMLSMAGAPALAATFVYVSNAEDGNIGMYTLHRTARSSRARASTPPRS